jgi:hypothetical protein
MRRPCIPLSLTDEYRFATGRTIFDKIGWLNREVLYNLDTSGKYFAKVVLLHIKDNERNNDPSMEGQFVECLKALDGILFMDLGVQIINRDFSKENKLPRLQPLCEMLSNIEVPESTVDKIKDWIISLKDTDLCQKFEDLGIGLPVVREAFTPRLIINDDPILQITRSEDDTSKVEIFRSSNSVSVHNHQDLVTFIINTNWATYEGGGWINEAKDLIIQLIEMLIANMSSPLESYFDDFQNLAEKLNDILDETNNSIWNKLISCCSNEKRYIRIISAYGDLVDDTLEERNKNLVVQALRDYKELINRYRGPSNQSPEEPSIEDPLLSNQRETRAVSVRFAVADTVKDVNRTRDVEKEEEEESRRLAEKKRR